MKKSKGWKTLLCAAAICGAVSLGCLGNLSALADVAPALCEVNGVSYQQFDEALTNWTQGTTLKLLEDCALSDVRELNSVTVTESKTLDLNGKTLKGTGSASVLRVTGEGVVFTVSDSSAGKTGKITGGSAVMGGGLYLSDATLNLSGGSVTGNEAGSGGGIYSANATINLNGGSIANNSAQFGGGIYLNDGALNVPDASASVVQENTASVNGGGIYALGTVTGSATIALNGGKICENSASMGGGVAVWGGASLDLAVNGEISANHAVGGAGVYVFGNKRNSETDKIGSFNMRGGKIEGNVGGIGFGSGVKVGGGGLFTMNGGSVTDNTTEMNGGGVSVDEGGEAKFGGMAQVTDNLRGDKNNNVFFVDGSKLTVEDNFKGKLGFSHPAYGVICQNYTGELDGFSADDPDYEIYRENSNVSIGSSVPAQLVVVTPPSKLTYNAGETPDYAGMTVKVVYKDGRETEVKDYTADSAPLTAVSLDREISYTIQNVTVKTSVRFALNGAAQTPGTQTPAPQPGSGSGSGGQTSGGKAFPGGFIAIVVLSALYVVAFIAVCFITHGFRGKKKSK